MPSQEIFLKENKDMVKVNKQQIIRNAGPSSGLVLELKMMIKHKS